MFEKVKAFIKNSIPEIVLAALSVLVGVLSAFLTKGNMDIYERIEVPPLAPPSWLFPIAWGILYILMGIGAGMIYKERTGKGDYAQGALMLFFIQLVFNFFWSIIFFNLQTFWLSLAVLIALLLLVVIMSFRFYKIRPIAAYLQIPYIVWLAFAIYLNLAIAILN